VANDGYVTRKKNVDNMDENGDDVVAYDSQSYEEKMKIRKF
jgi:hypothetical protein